jgi:GT2 family glycosyltransferase
MSKPVSVSIVIPTCNRLTRLRNCLDKTRQNVSCRHEIIVVDGASEDGTRDFLATQHNLRVIYEDEREGAVRAFNKGFKAARGTYVMWINDDSHPLEGSVESAVRTIQAFDDVGMVAFYHDWERTKNVLDEVIVDDTPYRVYDVRGYPYANFGLIRRSLLQRLDYADERYFFFGFDPDLSLKVQLEAGLKVIGCRQALIHHEEFHDERKLEDLAIGAEDNQKLFAKWNLPEPGTYPDPASAYREMIHDRMGVEQSTATLFA